jgi:hypothetical protein
VPAQLFFLLLMLMLMLMLVLVIEDAVILLPANNADERANDPTASLYGAASKARMTKE